MRWVGTPSGKGLSAAAAFGYIGITQVWTAAIEHDKFGDERLARSIQKAEALVDELVGQLGALEAAA